MTNFQDKFVDAYKDYPQLADKTFVGTTELTFAHGSYI